MPVIFIKSQLQVVSFYVNIKCYVIFFIYHFYCIYYDLLSFNQRKLVSQLSPRQNTTRGKLATGQMDIVRGIRCYSSSSQESELDLKTTKRQSKNISRRKNLSSPESRPYAGLYKGRGIPKDVPAWVKDVLRQGWKEALSGLLGREIQKVDYLYLLNIHVTIKILAILSTIENQSKNIVKEIVWYIFELISQLVFV